MSSSQQSSGHTWTEGDFEHPNEKIRHSLIVALVFAFTLPTVAVGLRLLARRMTGSRLFLDDYLILVALVWLIVLYLYGKRPLIWSHGSFSNMDVRPALSFVSEVIAPAKAEDGTDRMESALQWPRLSYRDSSKREC